jgi:ketol-acid reductoisomerase
MTTGELLENAAWLIEQGVHPELAAQELGKKPRSLARLAHRHGMTDLGNSIEAPAKRVYLPKRQHNRFQQGRS